jgi:hypothetical protein
MKTLAEISAIFAELDDTPEGETAQLDKALRNLSQRHYFPPDAQEGKAFKYSRESIVTLRLAYIASVFGLDRMTVDALNKWLRQLELTKRGSTSNIGHAIRRTAKGETFAIHIEMDATGRTWCKADWETAPTVSTRGSDVLDLIRPAVARFTLPCSDLIRDLLPLFGD